MQNCTEHVVEGHGSRWRSVGVVPRWWPLASFATDRPVRSLAARARHHHQRAARGWSERDVWSLDFYLCTTLAGQLNHLADNAHGWPGNGDYPRFDDWTAALRKAAAGLDQWADRDSDLDGDGPDTEVNLAVDAVRDQDALAAAQESLRWVADNLGILWD